MAGDGGQGRWRVNLVYVVSRPPTRRDGERYGVFRALERGHAITVADVSRPTFPMLPVHRDLAWVPAGVAIDIFDDWSEPSRLRRLFEAADLVILLNQSYGPARNNLKVLRQLAAAGTPYLIMAPNLYGARVPRLGEVPVGRRLAVALRRIALIDPLNSIIARLPPRMLGVPSARYIVVNGLASCAANPLVGPETLTIAAHAADYDIFLRVAEQRRPAENTAVFLDQFVPFHPDMQAVRASRTIDPETYYAALRRLFERIEAELGLEVVVAAHPRADYEDRPELLGNRRIIRGMTAEMVASCRLVLSHVSTALGFAVLFKKPVMLIVTNDLYYRTPAHMHANQETAVTLGTPLHFIDDCDVVSLADVLSYSEAAYERYVTHYLRHPQAGDGLLWDIVFDRLEADLAPRGQA